MWKRVRKERLACEIPEREEAAAVVDAKAKGEAMGSRGGKGKTSMPFIKDTPRAHTHRGV